MKKLNILSLFDGMSCGQIALRELGININKYYASEIDKFAIKQTQHNFPNTIQLGCVTKIKAKNLDKIDLLIGGSPCQGFSFAGKQLNFNDQRSKLFFEFIRLWKEILTINPNAKFLLENVNMKKKYLGVISECLGVFPVRINSNLVSAQNRDRYYWTNIRTKKVGLFDELFSDIPQPKDKGILLKDILQPENEINEKFYMKNIEIKRGRKQAEAKIWHTGNKMGKMDFPNNINKKAKTLTTVQTTGGRETNHIGVLNTNGVLKQTIKANCIDANYFKGIDNHAQRTCVLSNEKIRKLTPTECARLQTIPKWYKWIVSDTQIYRMLGNGWTVEVIKHIFSFIKAN